MDKVSQNMKILHHLEDIGKITVLEAIQQYGITRLSGRIWDLRAQGYPIVKTMVVVKNRYGEDCRVAQYTLAEDEK